MKIISIMLNWKILWIFYEIKSSFMHTMRGLSGYFSVSLFHNGMDIFICFVLLLEP